MVAKAIAFAMCCGFCRGNRDGRPAVGRIRKRSAFPRPCATHPPETCPPETPQGQRLPRRGRSARHGRGGRWPGLCGPAGTVDPASRGEGDGLRQATPTEIPAPLRDALPRKASSPPLHQPQHDQHQKNGHQPGPGQAGQRAGGEFGLRGKRRETVGHRGTLGRAPRVPGAGEDRLKAGSGRGQGVDLGRHPLLQQPQPLVVDALRLQRGHRLI